MISFKKYEGLGNDFIIPATIKLKADDTQNPLNKISPEERKRWSKLCDRKLSIGADGVLLHFQSYDGVHYMAIINQDGSMAEMCGNGLRCMALHLHQMSLGLETSFTIETQAGSMKATHHQHSIRCNLGPAQVQGTRIIKIDGRRVRGYPVNTGNPHFVVFEHLSTSDKLKLGPLLSLNEAFSNGVNVSFAEASENGFKVAVFERGCGWTQACGTAAVATTAAAWLRTNTIGQPLNIELPGGILKISGQLNDMIMEGPATYLFSGFLPEIM